MERATDTDGQACFIFTNPRSLQAMAEWGSSADRKDGTIDPAIIKNRVFDIGPTRVWVAFVPADKAMPVMLFASNPGLAISTRGAEEALRDIDSLIEVDPNSPPPAVPQKQEVVFQQLRERIISIWNRAPLRTENRPTTEDVYLYQNGMAAIYYLHHYLLSASKNESESVLFGFPFHSTQHIFEDFNTKAGTHFLMHGDDADLATLRTTLEKLSDQGKTLQAVWTEFPSNPNCITPNLFALRALADKYNFPLIIDDTIASPANVDVLPMADAVVTSLTKSFSGYADVMGGSIILNPASPHYSRLKRLFETNYLNELHHAEASHLLSNSHDFLARSAVYNRNSAALASYFSTILHESTTTTTKQRPQIIHKIYHPLTLPSQQHYTPHLRPATPDLPAPGHGLLLTVDFVSMGALAAFYDKLDLWKGPHLGGHVTLALPYIYGIFVDPKDVKRIAQWGYRSTQLRFAVGLEEWEDLKGVLDAAVAAAEAFVGRKSDVGGQSEREGMLNGVGVEMNGVLAGVGDQ
jgi:cystathionine gamma-synthase